MKGIFNLKPHQPRHTKTWEVNKLLLYLRSLGPNQNLRFKEIVLKTASFLTILAGRRSHTLHMLNASHMDRREDRVIFT